MTFPITPDPASCQGEERSADELLALCYTPSVTIPLGPRADEAAAAAVTNVVIQVFSCFAAADFSRATALFTDDLTRTFGPEPGTSMEDARAFLEGPPMPEEGGSTEIVSVSDVMQLNDGRLGAIAIEHSEGGLEAVYITLEQQDGRWIVAEVIDFASAA
jgi:hypothetical protein